MQGVDANLEFVTAKPSQLNALTKIPLLLFPGSVSNFPSLFGSKPNQTKNAPLKYGRQIFVQYHPLHAQYQLLLLCFVHAGDCEPPVCGLLIQYRL